MIFIDMSEDFSLFCVGFGDFIIRVFIIFSYKFRSMKIVVELDNIDRDVG